VAWVPCVRVATRALDALAADRRFTPRGSLTQIANGSAGAEGTTTVVDFGTGNDAGHDVGEACGSMLLEAEG